MKKIRKVGAICGLVGLAVGGPIAYEMSKPEPASEANARVAACADKLGSHAMFAEKIPQACQTYTESFPVRTISIRYENGTDSGEKTRDYVLPPAAKFQKENLTTDAEVALQTHNNRTVGLSVVGLVVLCAIGADLALRGEEPGHT